MIESGPSCACDITTELVGSSLKSAGRIQLSRLYVPITKVLLEKRKCQINKTKKMTQTGLLVVVLFLMVWTKLNVPFTSNSEYEFKLKVWSWRCSGLSVLLGVFLFRWEMFSLFLFRACGVLALPGVLRPRPYQTKQQTFKLYKRLINGINASERPWTHLAGRQRWFLESGLVGGSPKAWVKDASWSSECWSGVELSRGTHVKYIEGTVVATWGSTPTFLIFPGVGVSANRLLGGACLAVPYSISSCVCLVFFICCFQTDENKVFIHTLI